jgi:hypothetical protein
MSGKAIASLAKLKTYTSNVSNSGSQTVFPPTLEYLQLLERREGELWVKYRDRGWFIYSRAIDGNLGLEHQEQTAKHKVQTLKILKHRSVTSCLVYSECWKTLKSSISDTPLPNKVAEWISTLGRVWPGSSRPR